MQRLQTDEWDSSYDMISSCPYASGIDCYEQYRCENCGWNPFVSMQRITENYGPEYVKYLSTFKE